MIGSATSGKRGQQHRLQEAHRTPFGPRPADQKPHQHLLIIFVDAHAMIIDGRLQHDLAQVVEIAAERLVIAVGDLVGLGEERRPPSMSRNRMGRRKSKLELPRVEQMKHRHVVLAEPQVLEAAAEQLGLDEQVRDDDAQAPAGGSSRPARAAPGTSWVSPFGCVCSSTSIDGRQVGRVAARAECSGRCPGPRTKARPRLPAASAIWAIAPASLPGVFDLGDALRAELHRPAGVEHQAAAEIGVGLELLDEEPIGPPVSAPVEPPQIVAGHVLAILGELDARPPMRAGMPARDGPQHRPPRKQRQPRQPRQHARIQEAPLPAIGKHQALLVNRQAISRQ